MRTSNSGMLKKAAVLVGVAVLTGAVGVVVSAQMGPGRGRGMGPTGQGMGPGGPGMGPGGQGMMGRGMGMRGGPGGPGGILGPVLRGVDLTDQQREAVRGIVQSHQEQAKAINQSLRNARKALDEAASAEIVNEDAIRAAAIDLGKAEGEAAVLRANVQAEAFGVLTPEQQQKAKEMRSLREQRMKRDGADQGIDRHARPERPVRPERPGRFQEPRSEQQQQDDLQPGRLEMV